MIVSNQVPFFIASTSMLFLNIQKEKPDLSHIGTTQTLQASSRKYDDIYLSANQNTVFMQEVRHKEFRNHVYISRETTATCDKIISDRSLAQCIRFPFRFMSCYLNIVKIKNKKERKKKSLCHPILHGDMYRICLDIRFMTTK